MKIHIYLLAFLFVCTPFLCTKAENSNRIVAKVNNTVITEKDLQEYIKLYNYRMSESGQELGVEQDTLIKESLTSLINDKLLLDEAKKEEIEVPSSWVEDRINDAVKAYSSFDQFEQSLIDRGMTITLLKKRFQEQYIVKEIVKKYVDYYIRISPQEITRYYQTNIEEFQKPSIYKLWITKAGGKYPFDEIVSALETQEFETVNNNFSNAFTKIETSLSELNPEIISAIESKNANEHAIITINNIPHLIYLEEKQPARKATFQEVKNKVYNILYYQKKMERFQEWIKLLREKAVIDTYL